MALYALFLAIISAVVFAPLGIHASDEGYVLAGARRILAGQVPHRDFITTRPPLSQLLHLPEIAIFGSHALLPSRVISIFQFVIIALCVTIAAQELLGKRLRPVAAMALLTAVFFAVVNVFPLMAWHSTDAVTLSSVGLLLVFLARKQPEGQWGGLFVLGLAYLARQNFALVAPAALVMYGGWRFRRNWLAVVAPGLMYLSFLAAFGITGEAFRQLLARSEIVQTGVMPLLAIPFLAGAAFGLLCAFIAHRYSKAIVWWALTVALGGLLLAALVAVNSPYYQRFSWAAMGLLLGLILFEMKPLPPSPWVRWAALVWLIAWSSAISLGWNYPTLFFGAVVAAVVCWVGINQPIQQVRWFGAAIVALAVLTAATVTSARLLVPEGEVPYFMMSSRLDGVNGGLAGIRTSATMGRSMADLEAIKRRIRGPYILLPQQSVNWVLERRSNPLVTDYPEDTELPSRHLRWRLLRSLRQHHRTATFIVARRRPVLYFHEELHQPSPYIPDGTAIDFVKDHLTKIESTEFYDVYRYERRNRFNARWDSQSRRDWRWSRRPHVWSRTGAARFAASGDRGRLDRWRTLQDDRSQR